MGFAFFKSKREKEREARKARRQALRRAEGAIDEVEERIKRMEKEAEADWGRAREATRDGRAAAAQRALTSYRAAQVLITKLEQKKWVFKQVLMKLETAGTDAEFAQALGNTVIIMKYVIGFTNLWFLYGCYTKITTAAQMEKDDAILRKIEAKDAQRRRKREKD